MLNFIGLIYGGRIDIKSYFIIQFITRCDIILGNKLISGIYDAFWSWIRQIILMGRLYGKDSCDRNTKL